VLSKVAVVVAVTWGPFGDPKEGKYLLLEAVIRRLAKSQGPKSHKEGTRGTKMSSGTLYRVVPEDIFN
jgi:hypothetical protein